MKNAILNKPLVSSIKHKYGWLFIKVLMKKKDNEVFEVTFEDFIKFLEKEGNNILSRRQKPAFFYDILALIRKTLQAAGEVEGVRVVLALEQSNVYVPTMYTQVVVKTNKVKSVWNPQYWISYLQKEIFR